MSCSAEEDSRFGTNVFSQSRAGGQGRAGEAAERGKPQPALAASAALRIASSVAFGVIRLPS